MTRPWIGFSFAHDSQLDGAPCVTIFTSFGGKLSRNSKTGPMLQSFILRRDLDPQAALQSGQDSSICGNCRWRPFLGGKCYVSVVRAPLVVWRAWARGRYEPLDLGSRKHLARFHGRQLRIGSYGDPVAAPFALWGTLLAMGRLEAHTGYTHQWRLPIAQRAKGFLMASVDSAWEKTEANSQNWRTFRVKTASEIPSVLRGELSCPASAEQDHRLTCATCGACSGNLFGRSDVSIIAHGVRMMKGKTANVDRVRS